MTGGWRGYRAVVRASLQVGVVYRLGFFFTVLGNLIFLALTYHLWRAVYGDRTVLNGLTFDQAYLYVALGSTMFVLLKVYSDWDVAWDIRDGMIAQGVPPGKIELITNGVDLEIGADPVPAAARGRVRPARGPAALPGRPCR